MKRLAVGFVLILSLIQPVISAETSNVYLIDLYACTAGNLEAMEAFGSKGNRQPCFIGGVLPTENLRYGMLAISENDVANTNMTGFVSQGKAILWRKFHGVNGVWDASVGGYVDRIWIEQIDPMEIN